MNHRRNLIRTTALAATLAALLTPAPASADLRATAFVGATRINDTNKGTLGAAVTLGWLSASSSKPRASGSAAGQHRRPGSVEANMTTYMGNLVVRAPTGPISALRLGRRGRGAGHGQRRRAVPRRRRRAPAHRMSAGTSAAASTSSRAPNIGLRADVRRFQTGDVVVGGHRRHRRSAVAEVRLLARDGGVTIKF